MPPSTALCPHCSQPLPPPHGVVITPNAITRNGVSIRLTAQETRLFERLVERFNKPASFDSLITAVYPNDTDEPDDAKMVLRTLMAKTRPRIAALDLGVECVWGFGYSLKPLAETRPTIVRGNRGGRPRKTPLVETQSPGVP